MKIRLSAVIIALTAMSFTLLAWVMFNSTFGYSIKFPNTPVVTAKAGGEVVKHAAPGMPAFIVDYEQKGAPYVAIPNVINDKVTQYINSKPGSAGVVPAWAGPVAAWKGCQSREATINFPSGLRTNIRVAILGNECWILIAEHNGAFTPAADWNQFLNSFQH